MYYICIHKHARLEGSGGMLPQEIFKKIRCSEVVSEDISGWKQSRSSYMARGVLHPIFWLAMYACALQRLSVRNELANKDTLLKSIILKKV